MAMWAFNSSTLCVAIGSSDRHSYMCLGICVQPTRLAHICQAIYNVSGNAQESQAVCRRSSVSGPLRSHASAAPEPDCRQGDLRLLFRGNPGDQPAENLAPLGLFAPRGYRGGAAPVTLDALPPGYPTGSRGIVYFE